MPLSHLALPARSRTFLMGSVFLIASCGLVYELVAGSVSSYILGDAITQFSLVIGVFLSAMGLGSYLAKYFSANLLASFVEIEIWIGLIGGGSSLSLFVVNAFAQPLFEVFLYSLCAVVGILIGIEIPLLIRILKQNGDFSSAVSHVLALDYIGALVGAIFFPLVILPYLGLSRASLVFGIMNLAVAWGGMTLLRHKTKRMVIFLSLAALVLVFALLASLRIVAFLEDMLYQDSIIYAETSPYQRIVVTRWRNDIRLYLNGKIQFSSVDEARYHESLVIPAMEACRRPRDILILGGGDGLAAREVLKYKSVKHVTLVDLDARVSRLGQEHPEFIDLNKGAMNSKRVSIVNQDGMQFVEKSPSGFDVIIVDLPDPSSESMAKLYSTAFYALCSRRLREGGILVTQATSPFYAPQAFWCIARSIGAALPQNDAQGPLLPLPYHVNVPSFGEWGFVMAARKPIVAATLSVSVPTRFLNKGRLQAMFSFGKDMLLQGEVGINRLDLPILGNYYNKGWRAYNQ